MWTKQTVGLTFTLFWFQCGFYSALGQAGEEDPYTEANLFEGLCWNDVVAEAGKLITRDERNIGNTVNWNCKTTMKSQKVGHQIRLSFQMFNLINSTACETEKVQVYDGDSINSPLLTPEEGVCGSDDPGQYFSTGTSITVHYSSSADEEPPSFSSTDDVTRGFVAYWTSYKAVSRNEDNTTKDQGGKLIENEDGETLFCCIDNSLCVNSRYRCDGINNCPDHSDETLLKCKLGKSLINDLALLTGISVEIWAIIIAIVVFAILLTIVLTICCCCCRGTKKKTVIRKILYGKTKEVEKRKKKSAKTRERVRRKKRRVKKRSQPAPPRNYYMAPIDAGNITPLTLRSEAGDSIYFTDTSLDTFGMVQDRPALLATAAMATRQGMLDPTGMMPGEGKSSYYTGYAGDFAQDFRGQSSGPQSNVVVNRLHHILHTNSEPVSRDSVTDRSLFTASGFHIPRVTHAHKEGDQCSLR
ncbi:uncharacterized protein [Ptychodera flava]|uniref:uncharacterized protein n=1 Tax=Ptychodera flava TaxID=63121 RepID=UPI003969C9BB